MNDVTEEAEKWLEDRSDVAALVLYRWLEPVDGTGSIIFPPTYAKPVGMREEEWRGYNIDVFPDGSSVCQIDSVGSQANRMEPIFKREPYSALVPSVRIKAIERNSGNLEREIDLLDAGHRAADAVARFSTLGPRLDDAFRAYKYKGDAEPLARIAPTSIVFGCWDSRATQVKLPRTVRSVIRAYNARRVNRSAQYSTIAGEILEGGDAEVTTKGVKAELGLAHVPRSWTPGGVQVTGEIRQEAVVNLVTIRALESALGKNNTRKLQAYIFSLALVALQGNNEFYLREGCHLVSEVGRAAEWSLVRQTGSRAKIDLTQIQSFAENSACAFGVEAKPIVATFNADLARKVAALSEKERKNILRQGPVTVEAYEKLKKASKSDEKGDS